MKSIHNEKRKKLEVYNKHELELIKMIQEAYTDKEIDKKLHEDYYLETIYAYYNIALTKLYLRLKKEFKQITIKNSEITEDFWNFKKGENIKVVKFHIFKLFNFINGRSGSYTSNEHVIKQPNLNNKISNLEWVTKDNICKGQK